MNADIDIDTPSNFDPTEIFNWLRASMVKDAQLVAHPCGVHPQTVPGDPISGLAAIPYREAQAHGYFKIDFLHLGVYDNFSSRDEIDALLELEPDWNLLVDENVQQKLFQLSKHGDILNTVKPKNIEELADVLALIRPGKRQLLKLYMAHRESTRRILYARDEQGYSFKKSHAVAYALVIKLQLLLVQAGVL
jgi:hypothetical protein